MFVPRLARAFLAATLALIGGSGRAAPDETPRPAAILAALRDADMRLATVGERLAIANAPLCADREPRTGLVLHDLAQYGLAYRDAARAHFKFTGPIAVEGVVAGSASDTAGVRADDVITAIEGVPLDVALPDARTPVGTQRLVAVYQKVNDADRDGRINLTLSRDGVSRTVQIEPQSACATRFELVVRDGEGDLADGTIVQISARVVEETEAEDELAAWIAHELAHNILRHRARLAAAGVNRGMFESFGADVSYIRRSEIEADMLGVSLIANAGYDVGAAARLWRRVGPKRYGSFLRARTHPKWSTRVKILEREAAAIAPLSVRPVVRPILAEREKPMSNDWQSLQAGL